MKEIPFIVLGLIILALIIMTAIFPQALALTFGQKPLTLSYMGNSNGTAYETKGC